MCIVDVSLCKDVSGVDAIAVCTDEEMSPDGLSDLVAVSNGISSHLSTTYEFAICSRAHVGVCVRERFYYGLQSSNITYETRLGPHED